jgi:hypothetical protein
VLVLRGSLTRLRLPRLDRPSNIRKTRRHPTQRISLCTHFFRPSIIIRELHQAVAHKVSDIFSPNHSTAENRAGHAYEATIVVSVLVHSIPLLLEKHVASKAYSRCVIGNRMLAVAIAMRNAAHSISTIHEVSELLAI